MDSMSQKTAVRLDQYISAECDRLSKEQLLHRRARANHVRVGESGQLEVEVNDLLIVDDYPIGVYCSPHTQQVMHNHYRTIAYDR
jgi:hypothetical protein